MAQNEYTLKGWRTPPLLSSISPSLRLPLPLCHDKKSCSPRVNESQLFSLSSTYSRSGCVSICETVFTPFRWDSAGGCFHLGVKEMEKVRLTKLHFNYGLFFIPMCRPGGQCFCSVEDSTETQTTSPERERCVIHGHITRKSLF